MGWLKIKKYIYCFEALSSLILCSYKPFLHQIVTYEEKWSLYDNQQQLNQWLDQEEATKHFSKPNSRQNQLWSLFGGLLSVWSTTTFWILMKPPHLRGMLSKSMRCTKNCNACSCHGQQKGPNSSLQQHMPAHRTINASKGWAMKFCLIHHSHLTSHQLTTTSSIILTTFAGKTLPQPA